MPLDQYSPCPCGSGKKFKWCCQAISDQIVKAYQLNAQGQHEAALRTMDDLLKNHPDKPEAWGRKAELLFLNERYDEAEAALQKALQINPNYPFGHFLRGQFRLAEGEIAGALLLFRKAASVADPEGGDLLAMIYRSIAECELRMNHPVAMHAALKIASRLEPASEELRKALTEYFGDKSRLPSSIRKEYSFMPPTAELSSAQRSSWDEALRGASSGKLSDAAWAFGELSAALPDHAPGWYNLGLVRSWLGDNAGAVEAFDRYVSLESDPARAAAAWTLAEGLHLGQGMEDRSDFLEYSVLWRIVDPQQVGNVLRDLQDQRRLLALPTREGEPVHSFLILEYPVTLTAEQSAQRLPHIGAFVLVFQDRIRLWHTDAESFERTVGDFRQKAGPALADEHRDRQTAGFNDVLAPAVTIPVGINDEQQARKRTLEEFQRWMEETWIHKPLRSLGNVPPIDAAGHPVLSRKLSGVISFLEECAAMSGQLYDFNRLCRKVGLARGEVRDGGQPAAAPDLSAMSAAELAAIDADRLSDEQLEQAYQGALKLDARELAGRFARVLVSRPVSGTADRGPLYFFLAQQSLGDGSSDAALDWVNEGIKSDCEHNQGRRRNDYELRRGQIHARRGEAELAQDVFDRLIERAPSELKYRVAAAEAMLSARQGDHALRIAEAGLAESRRQNNRDSEQHFLELVDAAKKQARN